LARHLGITTQTLRNYSNKDEFANIIDEAKQRIEESLEEKLPTARSATGIIFALKSNFYWNDGNRQDGNMEISRMFE
jgi:hypothetical protein